MNEQPVLTVKKFCIDFSISKAFLYNLWARNEGPVKIKVGRKTLIRVADAHAWLNSLNDSEV